ncbi:hypothetical protein [Sulfitobacter guttiformis]|uniref:Phage-related protein n=1 Tax=Sulfitobacter guttiformis TaxID=74349 RepID=A0A420DHA8_9RHOB|nr:hypothetical protein [Sulfitobacter guttiformis]KIN72673.1 hypothetical protein Z949_1851 [Sulfitobacter guttiformis KCTC 32187]RKE93599.1 hypothetical protein C8N30_2676 [Sulfitobacter guttiformis]
MAKPDIEITLSATGLDDIRAAFASVRGESSSTGREIQVSAERAAEGFGGLGERVDDALSRVQELISTIGKITLGAAIAGAGLFAAAMARAKQTVEGTTDVISDMSIAAKSVGALDDLDGFNGISFAFERAGGSAEQALAVMVKLRDLAFEASEGSKEAESQLAQIGVTWQEIINPDTREMNNAVDIVKEIAAGYEGVAKTIDGLRGSQKLFGQEAGTLFFEVLEGGSDDLEKSVELYRDLVGYREDDVRAAYDHKNALTREAAAWEGLRLSFFRGFSDYSIDSAFARTDGITAYRGLAEELGESFGELLYVITPKLTAAIGGLAGFLIDVFDYLATGDTNSTWITAMDEGISTAKKTFSDLKSDVQDGLAAFERISDSVESRMLPAIERLMPIFERGMAYIETSMIPAIDGITAAFARVSDFVSTQTIPLFGDTLAGAFSSVLDLLATGETDAPWLTALSDGISAFVQDLSEVLSIINTVKDAFYSVADFVTGTVLPLFDVDLSSAGLIAGFVVMGVALTKLKPILTGVIGLLAGADKILGKVTGAVLGFIFPNFRTGSGIVDIFKFVGVVLKDLFTLTLAGLGTIITKIGLVGGAARTAAAGAAGAAAGVGAGALAAGAAGAAAVAGTYVAVTSTKELDDRMKEIEQKTVEAAEKHGQAYAAGYLKSSLQQLQEGAGAGGFINDLFGIFGGGADFDQAIADTEEVIRQGGEAAVEAARRGAEEARGGVLSELENEISNIDTEINITGFTGIEESLREGLAEASRNATIQQDLAFNAPQAAPYIAPVIQQAPAQQAAGGSVAAIFQLGVEELRVDVSPADAFSQMVARANRGRN